MTEQELARIEAEVDRVNIPPCDGGNDWWWSDRYFDIQKLCAEVRRLRGQRKCK